MPIETSGNAGLNMVTKPDFNQYGIPGRFVKYFVAIVSLFFSAGTVQAQEWVLGAGFADFSRQPSVDHALIALEVHGPPFFENGRLSAGWAGAVVVDTSVDIFVGLGLSGMYQLDDRWFLESSIMPGYYRAASPKTDLGSKFEIRSLLGIGVALASGDRLSLAITHKSNASTAPVNPGVNSVVLRLRRRF